VALLVRVAGGRIRRERDRGDRGERRDSSRREGVRRRGSIRGKGRCKLAGIF
jgi:hypothetical protein